MTFLNDSHYLLDLQWLQRISYKLDRFKQVGTSGKTFVGRCPYCGDSQKSKRKARLYFYTKHQQLNFECKNCGVSGTLYRFVREQVPELFDEYKKDLVLSRYELQRRLTPTPSNPPAKQESSKIVLDDRKLKGCRVLSDLESNHPAVLYLLSRGIDRQRQRLLLYSDNFKVTADSIAQTPLSDKFPTDPRIVIPFYDKTGNIEMIQGRAIGNSGSLRYITIKAKDDLEKIYNKYVVDRNKTVYCVEGPLDSLFVDNCVATCDSALTRSDADVLIWDNQPRAKEIVELMEHAIGQGRSLVIWPTSPNEKIDINDMIKGGMKPRELMEIIKQRTFKGIRAKLELQKWRRM